MHRSIIAKRVPKFYILVHLSGCFYSCLAAFFSVFVFSKISSTKLVGDELSILGVRIANVVLLKGPIRIDPLHDPIKRYGINYARTQLHSGTFKTKKRRAGLIRVPLF